MCALLQHGAVWIVLVEDGGAGRRSRGAIEQFAFGGKVILHAAVVVEMVAGQVGKDGDVEIQARNTLLVESVGGYLHHRFGGAAVDAFAK